MAMPALKFNQETPVEERVARLGVNVEHILKDVCVLGAGVRRLSEKIDSVKDMVAALQSARAFDRVWWLLMSGALLGIMARAFKWI
jgi:hypothetical protein